MSEVTRQGFPQDPKNALQIKDYNVPIRFNDVCVFDGAFTFLKERFGEEMRRLEEEMTQFSETLHLYHAGVNTDNECSHWESLASSPLIEGEGETKTLKLQFDVSHFEPGEITVQILNNTLIVTAQHEEKSDSSVVYNRYNREFKLPSGVNPLSVESVLSKDGVLTVEAPLNMKELSIKDDLSTDSKNLSAFPKDGI